MKEKDFVYATRPINGIEVNSVGIIKSTSQEGAQVYFIGKKQDVTAPLDSLHTIEVKETGDRHEIKICNVCHIVKSVEEFEKNQNNSQGETQRRPSCKGCRKVITGKQMPKAEHRRMDLKRPPDQTIFVCPICEKQSIVGINAVIGSGSRPQNGKRTRLDLRKLQHRIR